MRPGLDWAHATLLLGTAALNCKAGVIGGAAGVAGDTEFLGCYIDLNGTAATLTIGGGFENSSGGAAPMVIDGQIASDVPLILPWPLLNEFGPFTFTPSISGVIWVFTRAAPTLP